MPMSVVNMATNMRHRVKNTFLFTLTTTQLQKMAAKISTSPTSIWSRQTLMPILSRLSMVPSYINYMTKSMMAHAMVMQRKDLYLKRSSRLYSMAGYDRLVPVLIFQLLSFMLVYGYGTNYRSSMVSYYSLLVLAILFMDFSKTDLPCFNEKLGVSSIIHRLYPIIAQAGTSIKTPAMIFQLWIIMDRNAMAATPRENMTCNTMNDRYLIRPTSSYFRNVQCRVIVALVPRPMRKLPMPTMNRLNDSTSIHSPIMLIIHEKNQVFLRPQLSAIWDITKYPTNEPMQDMDCNNDDIHLLQHSMYMPQSRDIDRGIGCVRWAYHSSQDIAQMYYSQVVEGGGCLSSQLNYGTMQKKLRENRIMPASSHLSPKLRNSST